MVTITAAVPVLLGILCTETITQLVVHSEIFLPVRELAASVSDFTGKLFNCGYCFSLWAAIPCAYMMAPLNLPTANMPMNLLIWTLAFHRLSNFLDDFVDRYLSSPVSYEADATDFTNQEEIDFSAANDHFGMTDEASDNSESDSE